MEIAPDFTERICIFYFTLLSEIVGTHVPQYCVLIFPDTLPRTCKVLENTGKSGYDL